MDMTSKTQLEGGKYKRLSPRPRLPLSTRYQNDLAAVNFIGHSELQADHGLLECTYAPGTICQMRGLRRFFNSNIRLTAAMQIQWHQQWRGNKFSFEQFIVERAHSEVHSIDYMLYVFLYETVHLRNDHSFYICRMSATTVVSNLPVPVCWFCRSQLERWMHIELHRGGQHEFRSGSILVGWSVPFGQQRHDSSHYRVLLKLPQLNSHTG